MKNYKKFYIFILLLALTANSLFISAMATNTTLTTTVPTHSSVEIVITGNGSLTVGDVVYTESTFAEVERHKEITYKVTPDSGYYIESVKYNGKDVTAALVNNSYTISYVNLGDVLTVTFAPISDVPSTGDNDLVHVYLCLMLISAAAFAVMLKARKITY